MDWDCCVVARVQFLMQFHFRPFQSCTILQLIAWFKYNLRSVFLYIQVSDNVLIFLSFPSAVSLEEGMFGRKGASVLYTSVDPLLSHFCLYFSFSFDDMIPKFVRLAYNWELYGCTLVIWDKICCGNSLLVYWHKSHMCEFDGFPT